MVRITAEDLADCMFVDADGNLLDPAITPFATTSHSSHARSARVDRLPP